MSLESGYSNKPLDRESAFAITLLTCCEITKNILFDRTPDDKKHRRRRKYLKKLDEAIEAINTTYPGYLPDYFIENAEIFHESIEKAVNDLLKTLKEEEKNAVNETSSCSNNSAISNR